MPTEIGRPSAQTIEQPRAPDTPPLSMALLGAVAVLTLVLHLATGAVLYRTHDDNRARLLCWICFIAAAQCRIMYLTSD